MLNELMNELMNEMNTMGTTANGAVTNLSTKSALLDFFAVGGALRNMPQPEQDRLIIQAWNENPELTLKAIFYFRDIRGGQGQRCGFYGQLKWLAVNNPSKLESLLHLVPEYGRWDDLYQLVDTPLETAALTIMKNQYLKDLDSLASGNEVSLLGKWLKSENASSPETKRLAKVTRLFFSLDSATYRKSLSSLRKFIGIVETKMSNGDWTDIEYSNVPSQAMLKYKTAFFRHDEPGMTKFISNVLSGDETVNTSTLYPSQIVSDIMHNRFDTPDQVDMLWKNLPDYIDGRSENSIAVVDVSGSMSGTPMEVAISLGIYLSEHATGIYKNKFITFSENPVMQSIVEGNIVSKVNGLRQSDWGFNTNIERVFDTVLSAAINNNLDASEMIDKLYIISDMEFDVAVSSNNLLSNPRETLMSTVKNKFESHGFKLPQLVFWNVNGSNSQYPMTIDDSGIQMVSGFSPSIFVNLMQDKFLNAYDLMVGVLMDERYNKITLI